MSHERAQEERARLVLLHQIADASAVVFIELLETPQRDWWIVADGRVVGLHLKSGDCPTPLDAAMKQGEDLSPTGGMSILCIGTTWRSQAFDHLADMSCRRGQCCRMREMSGRPSRTPSSRPNSVR